MRKLLVVIMVVSGLVLLAGCSDDDNPTAAGSTSALVGSWQGLQEVCDGQSENIDDQFINFAANGTGTGSMRGVPITFTWSVSGDQLTMTISFPGLDPATGTVTYSVVDDVLTIVGEDNCINTFHRI